MFEEIGDPNGLPIVFHNGTPCSRLIPAWWDEPARVRGLRILSFDRPGYGDAAARPGRTVAGVVSEMVAALDTLGVGRFATWGASGGCPYALGCGALLPDRVAAVASIAGNAPVPVAADREEYEAEIEATRQGRAGRDELLPRYESRAAPMRSWDVGALLTNWDGAFSPADKRALGDGETGEYLLSLIHEAIRPGVEGWVDDNLGYVSPWGFELADIDVPVSIWHGEEDLMVAVDDSRTCARSIPRADLFLEPGMGHPSMILRHEEPVMDWLRSHMVA